MKPRAQLPNAAVVVAREAQLVISTNSQCTRYRIVDELVMTFCAMIEHNLLILTQILCLLRPKSTGRAILRRSKDAMTVTHRSRNGISTVVKCLP